MQSTFSAVVNARAIANYGNVIMFVDADRPMDMPSDAPVGAIPDRAVYVRTQDIIPFVGICEETMNRDIYALVTPLYYEGVYSVAICIQRMIDLGGMIAWLGGLCAQISVHALRSETADDADSDGEETTSDDTTTHTATHTATHTGIFVGSGCQAGSVCGNMRMYVYGAYYDGNRDELMQRITSAGYNLDTYEDFVVPSRVDALIIEHEVIAYTRLNQTYADHGDIHVAIYDVTPKIKSMINYMAEITARFEGL